MAIILSKSQTNEAVDGAGTAKYVRVCLQELLDNTLEAGKVTGMIKT